MIPSEIIARKRDGIALSRQELTWFIEQFINNELTNSQMAAMLMAIYFKGMTEDETIFLVEAMINSGATLDFSGNKKYVADKHSTGGIGDKVSLILVPLLACIGMTVPMIAGRGLEFTGGTIDKLESIPGFKTNPTLEQFSAWVKLNGCAIIEQTQQICPVDNKLYSLRNVTATVPSIPLICSSIMSKKIAEGVQGLILDIKIGKGAFMKTIDQGQELGEWMYKIGKAFNLNTDIVFTSMDQPLGRFAGLRCEIFETMDCLNGNGPKDTMEVVLELGSRLILQAGLTDNIFSANDLLISHIENGTADAKFREMISCQGGDIEKCLSKVMKPEYEQSVTAYNDGFIHNMETEKIGWALVEMGGGHKLTHDELDYSAGIEFIAKTGDRVKKDDPVYRIFSANNARLERAIEMLKSTFSISKNKPEFSLILDSTDVSL